MIAKEHNMQYYKTSAVRGDNVELMINDTIEAVYKIKKQ